MTTIAAGPVSAPFNNGFSNFDGPGETGVERLKLFDEVLKFRIGSYKRGQADDRAEAPAKETCAKAFFDDAAGVWPRRCGSCPESARACFWAITPSARRQRNICRTHQCLH